MTNQFIQTMNNVAKTENDAVSYKSTLNPIIDFFFEAPALRNETDVLRIINYFQNAFDVDPQLALRILFYTRDCRGGQGERNVFRVLIGYLAEIKPDWVIDNLSLIPEFGRWDDLIYLLDEPKVANQVRTFLLEQLRKDCIHLDTGEITKISLCAKWMPSENATSKKTKEYAKKMIGLDSAKEYRQILSKLRKALNIVETKLVNKEYENIDYAKLPSYAALKYKDAFKRNDTERYEQYIENVKQGKEKINASVLYPYDIVRKYDAICGWGDLKEREVDDTLEVAWKALPDYVPEISGLVVSDTSGSMQGLPMDISMSLAIYVAERNKSVVWRDYTIPFSSEAQWIEVKGNTLLEKINSVYTGDCSNTNLQSVFNLILKRAKAQGVIQEDMPKVLIVVSDMEFDDPYDARESTNLEAIKQKYADAGYTLPKLVWWNVASRTNQVPAMEKDGCLFLSGSNPVCLKYALSGDFDAMKAIEEIVNRERYQEIVW